MSHAKDGKRRRPIVEWAVQPLEGRLLLSQAGHPVTSPPASDVASPQPRGTVTLLQASTQTESLRPSVTLVATVRTAGTLRVFQNGRVRFSVVSPTPETLGAVTLNRLGQATLKTSKLSQGGTYIIQAQYVSPHGPYASSSADLQVTVAEPLVTTFRITAPQYFGAPGTPLTFSVTALDRAHQVVTDYTGTIDLSSPTDHTAKFIPSTYTFTTADQGTHEFADGVTFHKGGAEVVQVQQISNTRIADKQKFGIE